MSQNLAKDDLTIHWKMTNPSSTPKQWHEWDARENFPNRPVESLLGWPDGTVSVLEKAFQLGLGRNVGWKIKDDKAFDAHRRAASVFRRGVAYSLQVPEELEGSYAIRFLDENPISELMDGQRPLIIDQQVAKAWNIPQGPQFRNVALGEQQKTLDTVALLYDWLQGQSTGAVDIIGGGLLADTAAFVAALTGRPFRLVPTTLLAMLDACVGGKTGVNFPPFGKNQIGLFAFPEEVVISPRWLETLSPREIKAGLAEGFKHALISGDKGLATRLSAFDPTKDNIKPYLKDLIQVKADIIGQDPTEQGLRAVLNLGHTLAHALERIAHMRGSDLLHGEAVSIGLLFMLEISRELGYLPTPVYAEMRSLLTRSCFLLSRAELQRSLGSEDMETLSDQLIEGIAQDKKNVGQGSSEWVLLKDWGKPEEKQGRYTTSVPHDEFRRIYSIFLERWI